ncbi:MAG: hypothetical protein ACJ8ER_16730 [Allosphingosinicella sp.]
MAAMAKHRGSGTGDISGGPRLRWAGSQQIGGVTELAVLSPIKLGTVPGERRTYEERLRAAIANLARRHQQGIPIDLDRVTTIHFGRMIVIRPEQYLLYSRNTGASYRPDGSSRAGPSSPGIVPEPIDAYERIESPPPPSEPAQGPAPSADEPQAGKTEPAPKPEVRSWLLTLVEFDGDLKAYMREIAQFIGAEFDRIFVNCEEYPKVENFDKFWAWIRTFQIKTDLFYASCPHLSVVRIRQLETFKRRFDAFVARVRSPTGPIVQSMDEMFDEFLRENQQYGSGFPLPGGIYPTDECHG